MDITIRSLDRDAATAFADLVAEAELGTHYRPADPEHRAWVERAIDRYVAAGAQLYGAFEAAGAPLGYVALLIDERPGFRCKGEIISLGVSPAQRRRGVGSLLVRHCLDACRELGLYCCYVATYAGAAETICFYLRCGFVPVATLPDVHGPGDEGQIHLRVIVGPPDWQP